VQGHILHGVQVHGYTHLNNVQVEGLGSPRTIRFVGVDERKR
jgi:hypothetical protein